MFYNFTNLILVFIHLISKIKKMCRFRNISRGPQYIAGLLTSVVIYHW